MALRVLLADESSTIKKVMLLALQDFGVDVKSVPVGLDVLTVAKSFKPDIVFADVLLAKKSGYDVSEELKKAPETKNTPVILMWSGFMELDEERAKKSLANDRLEKPFDAEILRALVRKYVPRTNSNIVSNYLTFPTMPEFNENPATPTEATPEAEDFQQVPLHNPLPTNDESWTHQNLQQFKVQTPTNENSFSSEENEFDKFMIPDSDLGQPKVESTGEFEEVSFVGPSPTPANSTVKPKTSAITDKVMSATETVLLERVARDEARAIISDICWKIMPEIAERVVREEISKLLKQAEKEL